VKNSWSLVRHITKVKNLEEGISLSGEKGIDENSLKTL
jgi:hypothetical protein